MLFRSAVAALVRLCAGLPLALAITAARAAESAELPLAALAADLDALRQGRDDRGRDLQEVPTAPPAIGLLWAEGMRSYVRAPLREGSRLFGALSISSDRPSAYSPDAIEVIRAKRDGRGLNEAEIGGFIAGLASGDVTEDHGIVGLPFLIVPLTYESTGYGIPQAGTRRAGPFVKVARVLLEEGWQDGTADE